MEARRRAASAACARIKLDRRSFLKLTGIAGGGLVLAFSCSGAADQRRRGARRATSCRMLSCASRRKGSILIYNKGPEIGQGIKTAFPLIIAEELDAKWSDVVVEQAPVNPAVYRQPERRRFALDSRELGSVAQGGRGGARHAGVARPRRAGKCRSTECTTRDSAVWNGKRKLTYGALAAKAAALPVPDAATVKLKERSEYRLLGKSYTGVDNRKVVTGAAAVRHRSAVARA